MTSPPAPAKPALVKTKSGKERPEHARWNEENLQENERIKAELWKNNPTMKITEPKTPYHAPLKGDLDAVEPLSLDGDAPGDMTAEERAEFEKRRKEHYRKEAEALKKATELAKQEEEEEAEEAKQEQEQEEQERKKQKQ